MAKTVVGFLLGIVLCVLSTNALVAGPWTIEISEQGFVLVSIADSDYRGTWMLELQYLESFLNSTAKVNWSDLPLDDRFRIRNSMKLATDDPLQRNLLQNPIDKLHKVDLSTFESHGIVIRGVLGREAFRDLRVQFLIEDEKPIVRFSELDELSNLESEKMGDAIPLYFDERSLMSATFNLGSQILAMRIETSGKNDFSLPTDIISAFENGRRSRRPVGVQTKFSSRVGFVPEEKPFYDTYFEHLFFEGTNLSKACVSESNRTSVQLGGLLRRNACFILNDNPVLYLSKKDNGFQTEIGFSEIEIRQKDGVFRVSKVDEDGRFINILSSGDEIVSLDSKSTKGLSPTQFQRLALDCFECGDPIEIRRDGILKQVTAIIPRLPQDQMIERIYPMRNNNIKR